MSGVLTGYRMQLRMFRAYPDSLFPLFMTPLLSVIFLMIVKHAGRADLTAYAVVAPVFMALWWVAVAAAGLVIAGDRWHGALELLVAAPVPFPLLVFGRILAVTSVGLFGFVEVWIVSKLLYRAEFTVHHPWQFTATLVASAATMAATALALSALFVLMRNAITFVNSSSYPFFVLGGVLVPVSFLPGWIQPVSSIVFLSWSADLMRATLAPGSVDKFGYRIAVLVGLGAVGLALGSALMVHVVRKVRASGELGFQ